MSRAEMVTEEQVKRVTPPTDKMSLPRTKSCENCQELRMLLVRLRERLDFVERELVMRETKEGEADGDNAA